MDWLNYHHLFYFWTVAREGSIARASTRLALAPPTISAQIRLLEQAIGEPLFTRTGRRLALTDAGRLVQGYADQIFGIGQEMLAAVRGGSERRPLTLVVGVVDVVPKLIAYRLLEPVLRAGPPVRLVCREDHRERLVADLAIHAVDVVIADAPASTGARVRAFDHLLGECGVSFFAAPRLRLPSRRFPQSLDGAPLLVPRETSAIRSRLERWFESVGVRPRIVGEFDDTALLTAFGESGVGVFPAATAIETTVRRRYGARVIGRTDVVRERFYMTALERRLTHPAVIAIRDAARADLFGA